MKLNSLICQAGAGRRKWNAAIFFALLNFITGATAQNYSIDWYTIDGGGGASSGGNFSLSGTIGQPDASAHPMTGGDFSLTGGFWSLFAVQTPGAPLLAIHLSGASVIVSWPSPSPGFILQQSTDSSSTNWVNAPQVVTDNGVTKSVTDNSSGDRRFYRLFKP